MNQMNLDVDVMIGEGNEADRNIGQNLDGKNHEKY